MIEEELFRKLLDFSMPNYLIGLNRLNERAVSHIYKGTMGNIKKAMCNKVPSSIWRNNLGSGICKTCLKNTLKDIKYDN